MNEKGISLVQLRQRKTRQTAALFLAPVIILLVVFIAYPIIDTFITSGYQWNGISADKKMVGLANWAKLIKDTKFWIAFKNNVIIMILSIIIQMDDEPGLLSVVLQTIARFHGNILTIHQSIPINGIATLTLSVDILPGEGDAEAMVETIEQNEGIHYLKILGRE